MLYVLVSFFERNPYLPLHSVQDTFKIKIFSPYRVASAMLKIKELDRISL